MQLGSAQQRVHSRPSLSFEILNRRDPLAVLTEQAADANSPAKYDVSNHSLVLFDRGEEIVVQAGDEGIRFLRVSGKPIEESVAWYVRSS